MIDINDAHIGIIGLGYVGLPLAAEFGKQFPTLGFDIDQRRIQELREYNDRTREVEAEELRRAVQLTCSHDVEDLGACNVFIVTVPTPIDAYKRPDLNHLIAASATVGKVLKPGHIVIYESTVYPGATEEICVPILEKHSGYEFNKDFFVGYSPERINPGDQQHRLSQIVKVTSGSTPQAAQFIDQLYQRVVSAGTCSVSSIKVAEAAKVIENTQRDVNIALINELAMIFNRLGIDTREILDAAGTKWNFLPFQPGLVGGHCIGVDPYYLTHKAQAVGFHPEMVLAGRRINDAMGEYVAGQLVKLMAHQGLAIVNSRILIMGLTFKENCPDLRNTRVIDIVHCLQDYNAQVDVYDPWADRSEAKTLLGYELSDEETLQAKRYDGIVIAVSHTAFAELEADYIRGLCKENGVIYDIKGLLPDTSKSFRL